jgi:membrane fusion protein (multidrug efflux system)
MKVQTRTGIYLTVLAIAIVLAWLQCSDEQSATDLSPETSAESVELHAVAEFRQLDVTDTLVAFVEPARDVDVSTRLEGLLIRVNLDIGDTVDSGYVMAVLEDTQYQLDLAKTRVRLDRTRSELERARALAEKSLIPAVELERAELADREAAVALEQAEYNLRLTAVRAPFDGVIVARWPRAGQWVDLGTPLFRLVKPGRPHARLFWDADQCRDWKVGDTLWCIRPDGGHSPGVISRASPIPDPASGTREFVVQLESDFPASSTSIRLVHLRHGGTEHLTIPREAFSELIPLRPGSTGTVTLLSNGKSRTARVTVGVVGSEWVEIVDGLRPGDTVRLGSPRPGSSL